MELSFSFTSMLVPVGDARARGSLEPGSTAFCSASYHAARSLGKPKAKRNLYQLVNIVCNHELPAVAMICQILVWNESCD